METGRTGRREAAALPDLDRLPAPVRDLVEERLKQGFSFGPPRTRKPAASVRELVASLQRG